MTASQIKKARSKKEWSQFDLAKKTGIDRSTISLFENGHRKATKEQKEKLKNAFRAN